MSDQKNKQEIAQILRMVETDQQNKLKQSKFHHHPNCLYHLQHQNPSVQNNTTNAMMMQQNLSNQNIKPNLTNIFAFKENALNQSLNEDQQQSVTSNTNSMPTLPPNTSSGNVCCHCHQSLTSVTETTTTSLLNNNNSNKLTTNTFKATPLINQVFQSNYSFDTSTIQSSQNNNPDVESLSTPPQFMTANNMAPQRKSTISIRQTANEKKHRIVGGGGGSSKITTDNIKTTHLDYNLKKKNNRLSDVRLAYSPLNRIRQAPQLAALSKKTTNNTAITIQ
jgi:hypothetical protein